MKYVLAFAFLLSVFYQARSQSDCPDLTGYIFETSNYFEPYPFTFVDNLRVDYYYKMVSPNTFNVKVDWSSLSTSGNYFRLNTENKRKMMIQAIIYYLLDFCPNSSTKTINFYEEKSCYKNKSCFIKVDQENSVYCYNQDWSGGEPDWFWYQGTKYYQVSEKQSCGTGCCITTYTLDCDEDVTKGYNRWSITNISYSSTGCDTTSTYNCLTNELLPCEAACE